jgi:hypothetical protein
MKATIQNNQSEYVTVQEFENIDEWIEHQQEVEQEVDDIEVFDPPDSIENDCNIL